MPIKTGPTLMDPVGAIARKIERNGGDLSHGSPSANDLVRWAAEVLEVDVTMERRDEIAGELFEDYGETYGTAPQVAAFLYSRLTIQ